MPILGADIAAEAREWIGTPFVWQGRVKGFGVDCKGLIAGVAKAVGRPEGDSLEALAGDYGGKIDTVRLRAGLARLFDPALEIRPGDVLLLQMGGKPQHLGLALTERRMVHCYPAGPQKVIEAAIGSRLHSIWRWREHAP
jgi:cell wall-associated NlpC family hydrolase